MTFGISKWQKYFANGPVVTTIKKVQDRPCYVYCDSIQIGTVPIGTPLTVLATNSYNTKYPVIFANGMYANISGEFITKPILKSGPTEELLIKSADLLGHSTVEHITVSNKIEVLTFNNSDSLIDSILHGLQNNPKVSPAINDTFKRWADDGIFYEIDWHKDIPRNQINELGKYVAGELFVGVFALEGEQDVFSVPICDKNVTKFAVPKDSAFYGVDSFLFQSNSDPIAISSKYGKSGKASIFANIVPEGIKKAKSLQKSEFKNFIDFAISSPIPTEIFLSGKGSSKQLVWDYGLNEILKLKIKDPAVIYTTIKDNLDTPRNLTGDAVRVLDAIGDRARPKMKEALPYSAMSFISHTIANTFMVDSNAIGDMKEIIANKNYKQVSLSVPDWQKGIVKYNVITSQDADLVVIGNGSTMKDYLADHGTLHYRLVAPKQ